MKKLIATLLAVIYMLTFWGCVATESVSETQKPSSSTKPMETIENSTPLCSSIRLSYHGNKNNSVLIEDENVCSKLMSFISKSGGTQGESTKGYYGAPYTLTIYYEGEQEPLVFSVWSSGQYSTSKHKDNEGYPFFYNDDISDMYKYLEEKYPDEFWYPITTDNSQGK